MADNDTYRCNTFAEFLAILNDGEFHQDLSKQLEELNAELNNAAADTGGKAKGRLTITLDFLLKGGVFEIDQDFTVKLPKVKRPSTVAWSTRDNHFTPQNPKQGALFGPREVRDVTVDAAVRTV
jgi:hypothetical protein